MKRLLLTPIIFSACSCFTVIPSDPDWRQHQQFCESVVGAHRNCVQDGGECVPVAMWCARRENYERFGETDNELDGIADEMDEIEGELMKMKEEIEKL
jgi:hypothetical protein